MLYVTMTHLTGKSYLTWVVPFVVYLQTLARIRIWIVFRKSLFKIDLKDFFSKCILGKNDILSLIHCGR